MNEDAMREEDEIASERAEKARALGTAILSKPIRELGTLRPPICLPPETKVRRAIEEMNRGSVGCVLVEQAGRLLGIFTERDLLTKVVARGLNADEVAIDAVMTVTPETLSLDDRIAYALNRMTVGGFRHVPLVDADNRPVGVIAMRNVVQYMVDLFPHEVLTLPPKPGANVSRTREGA